MNKRFTFIIVSALSLSIGIRAGRELINYVFEEEFMTSEDSKYVDTNYYAEDKNSPKG